MSETKTEFLLKKILYYTGPRQLVSFDIWSKKKDEEFEKNNEEIKESPPIESDEVSSSPKSDIEVAPINFLDESNLEACKLKVFKHLERYGFTSITISSIKAKHIIGTDDEGEILFEYFVKQKLGQIERNYIKGKKVTSVKFVFNKETRDKIYGEGKG